MLFAERRIRTGGLRHNVLELRKMHVTSGRYKNLLIALGSHVQPLLPKGCTIDHPGCEETEEPTEEDQGQLQVLSLENAYEGFTVGNTLETILDSGNVRRTISTLTEA